MPRLLRESVNRNRPLSFVGFPRQWLPLFEWLGVSWAQSIAPPLYVPMFSDLSEAAVRAMIRSARRNHSLRFLAEAAAGCDPVVADCLYILDHGAPEPTLLKKERAEVSNACAIGKREAVALTSWQSYGRPSLRALETKARQVPLRSRRALVLPCARQRPYDVSRTHRRIYADLAERGYDVRRYERIVISSIGVVPEQLWAEPEIVSYDAGVPDIYRTLRLVRDFFGRREYTEVLDCSEFEPYSDVLRIAAREGVIQSLRRIRLRRSRQFWVRSILEA